MGSVYIISSSVILYSTDLMSRHLSSHYQAEIHRKKSISYRQISVVFIIKTVVLNKIIFPIQFMKQSGMSSLKETDVAVLELSMLTYLM
jgi:hypothetical protein